MRKLIVLITILCLAFNGSRALADTYSGDLESTSSQYWKIASPSAGLKLNSDFTVMGWFKFETVPGGEVKIAGIFGTAGNKQYVVEFNKDVNNQLTTIICDDGTSCGQNSKDISTPSTGTWYHYAFVYTKSTGIVEYYVGGSSVGTGDTGKTSIYTGGSAEFAIGARSGGGEGFFDGRMDELRIYNKALSSADISATYNCELSAAQIADANLISYYKFENNANDTTANANNLTEVNTPTYQTDAPTLTGTCAGVAAPPPINNFYQFE